MPSESSGCHQVTDNPKIRIVAAVITDTAGRILVVRKRATEFFMQPGGKSEKGETPEDTLARELLEELGCELLSSELLGVYSAPAANEPLHIVEAALFRVVIAGEVTPRSEIEEIAWIDPARPCNMSLALLTRQFVLRWQFLKSGTNPDIAGHHS